MLATRPPAVSGAAAAAQQQVQWGRLESHCRLEGRQAPLCWTAGDAWWADWAHCDRLRLLLLLLLLCLAQLACRAFLLQLAKATMDSGGCFSEVYAVAAGQHAFAERALNDGRPAL